MNDTDKPSIIGHERVLIEMLTKIVHGAVSRRYDYTPIREERRGSYFEVLLVDGDGEPTGRIARIAVTLDRLADAIDLNTEGIMSTAEHGTDKDGS